MLTLYIHRYYNLYTESYSDFKGFLIEGMIVMCASPCQEPAKQIRAVTINIRARQDQRDLIDQAAEVQGKTRSEFMLESAYQKAQDVLLDQRFFGLDEDKFNQFLALLDTPPAPSEKLSKLMTTKAPWE